MVMVLFKEELLRPPASVHVTFQLWVPCVRAEDVIIVGVLLATAAFDPTLVPSTYSMHEVVDARLSVTVKLNDGVVLEVL